MSAFRVTTRRPLRRRLNRAGAAYLIPCLGPGAGVALAQCAPRWSSITQEVIGTSFLDVLDEDGAGPLPPALFVGGSFRAVGPRQDMQRVVRFDGWVWTAVPGTTFETPRALTMGMNAVAAEHAPWPGSGLYIGGSFTHVGGIHSPGQVAWTNSAFRAFPGPPAEQEPAHVFTLFDRDGPGPGVAPLYVGGSFAVAGTGVPCDALAHWNGAAWTCVEPALVPYPFTGARAQCLQAFDDDGPGPLPTALYVGGLFEFAGAIHSRGIARWDGSTWAGLGWGLNDQPNAMVVFDIDGSGPQPEYLYVGGDFTEVGNLETGWITAYGLARWDGQCWSAVPGWSNGLVKGLTTFDDDGPGPNKPALFCVGTITGMFGSQRAQHIVKWDGESWTVLPGLSGIDTAYCVQAFDEDGAGPNPGGLYVGGGFYWAGGLWSPGIARWGCPLPPRCYADCDQSTGPNSLDAFDFLCFLNRYTNNDPWACDCDWSTGPAACDVFDFLCFQNAFATGCR